MTQKFSLPIKVGKKYVRRDGIVVTAKTGHSGFDSGCVFIGLEENATEFGRDHVWATTGRVDYHSGLHQHDLVADFVEESQKKPKKSTAKRPAKETKMYTLEQLLQAIRQSTGYELQGYSGAIQEQLDKLTDPEYTEYLRLKNKFEN